MSVFREQMGTVLSAQLYCEPQTALKSKIYLKKHSVSVESLYMSAGAYVHQLI